MTKETEVTPAGEPIVTSRDRDPEAVEVVEDVEIIDDDEPISGADTDDPRSAIYARHGKKRERDIAHQDEEIDDGEPPADESALENSESAAIIDSDDGRASTPPDEDPLVEVVIFEQVRQVPQSKIDKAGGIQMYQMREAAQEQMRRNAQRAKELEEREKALEARESRSAKPPAVPATDQHEGQPPNDLPSDDQSLEAMARQTLEAVYDGDDNAPSNFVHVVQKVVSNVLAQNQGQTVNTETLRKQVTEEVLADQRRAKVVKARQALFDAEPELDKRRPDKFDHRLFQAVDDETDVVRKQHPDWEPEQVIQEAWQNVRKWRGAKPSDTTAARHREKQELNRPRAATGRHTPPPPPPRKTNSDYVADQRKQRGLDP